MENTKSSYLIKVAVIASLLVAGYSMVGNAADTATADVTATGVNPIAIATTTSMNFGSIVAPTSGTTTVILSTAAVRTGTATRASGATPTNAVFALTGTGALSYSATVTMGSGGAVGTGLTLSALKILCGGVSETAITSGGAQTCALTSGADTLKLGGTLTLTSAAVTATQAGMLSVLVAYN